MIFDIVVRVIEIIVTVLPFISVAGTIWLFYLWRKSGNLVLRAATITSTMATLGGMWWAFIAVRRLSGVVAPLPEWAILFHALSLLLILLTPVVKVAELLRIARIPPTPEELDKLEVLGYTWKQSQQNKETADGDSSDRGQGLG